MTDLRKDSLQVTVFYGDKDTQDPEKSIFNLYDELLLTDDFDSFLKTQAASYAFWANLRVEAQATYDKRNIDYSLWYASAYDFIKADFDEKNEKATINVIENKLKRVFSVGDEDVVKLQEKALIRCRCDNPFIDFAFNSYRAWQDQLTADKLYVEKLKVFERSMDMRGSMLQTLCANKRHEEKLESGSVVIDDLIHKEEGRRAIFDQAAARNSLLSRLNVNKK